MKNIFLKAALVLGSAFLLSNDSKAQVSSEVRDYYNNSSILTNDTVWFWVPMGTLHVYNFNQYNIDSVSITYKTRKTNVQLMSGAHSNFCMYHNDDMGDPQSQCYTPTVTLSGNFSTDPGEFNTLIADFSPGTTTPGVSIVRYTFFDINNVNDSVDLVLVYNATPVGITEANGVNVSEPYPNPSNGSVSVNYGFVNANSGTATITDVAGNVVYVQSLSAANGIMNIETSQWAKGMYLLNITDENGVAVHRKIVVQ